MKICIYHNNHPSQLQYGGEFSTWHLVEQAVKEGHEVEWITQDGSRFLNNKYKSKRKSYLEKIRKADLYLIGTFSGYPEKLLKQLINKKYAVMHHHSVDNGKHFLTTDNELSIFLAPDHEAHLPSVKAKNSYVTTCYIDHTKFFDKKEDRLKECVYIGTIAGIKIQNSMIRHMTKHVDAKYNFYGHGIKDGTSNYLSLMANVEVFEEVRQEDVNDILNKYEVFFWYIDRYGCYGRTIVEAALAGCRVVVNEDSFGIFKYDWDLSNRESIVKKLDEDLESFWTNVSNILNIE